MKSSRTKHLPSLGEEMLRCCKKCPSTAHGEVRCHRTAHKGGDGNIRTVVLRTAEVNEITRRFELVIKLVVDQEGCM